MQFDIYLSAIGNTPLFGDSYVRRPVAAIRRKSAPPRPPRPELKPWPKDAADTTVVEIVDGDQYDSAESKAPNCKVELSMQPGRISPVSEEEVSSSGSNSSNISPSVSLKKAPISFEKSALGRRRFSFESIRSAASNYSQQVDMKPETVQIEAAPADDIFCDIAMSNPFQKEAEDIHHAASSNDDRQSFYPLTRSRTVSVGSGWLADEHTVPMSRYNSQRAPPPTPEPEHFGKSLDEAWEDVKKALVPKLKVAIPPKDATAVTPPPSTSHALPPSPPPPIPPARNPRRLTANVSHTPSTVSRTSSDGARLAHAASSPTMAKSFKQQVDLSIPPVPEHSDVPQPLPASNMPMHIPAPLPTPAASVCSSEAPSMPSPVSMMSRSSSRFSYNAYNPQSVGLSTVPEPLASPTMSLSRSQSSGAPASPKSTGFHEPPPVAMPAQRQPPIRHAHSHKTSWSDSINSDRSSTWIGSLASSTITRMNTLRSVAGGEGANRMSFLPPIQRPSSSNTNQAPNYGVTTQHGLQSKPVTEIQPVKIIPLSEKFKGTNADDFLPKNSNNYAGFCKSSWRLQTGQAPKAFTLRTINRMTELANSTVTLSKTTTLKCSKCSFEGTLTRNPSAMRDSSYAPSVDYAACADMAPHTAHGIVYRWNFLFKSHVSCRATLRKDEMLDVEKEAVFGCLFCCGQGRGTVCFRGAKALCGHIAKEHGGENPDRELRMRINVVAGRQPAKGEMWDVILPGLSQSQARREKLGEVMGEMVGNWV